MSARFFIAASASAIAIGSALAITIASGCTGESAEAGLGEPIVVENGSFQTGDLPGSPPLDDSEVDAGATPTGSHVTVLDSANRILFPGESGKSLSGRVTGDSSSVGLRFADLGTGFWVVTLGSEDPQNPGELGWSLHYDVGRDIPPGLHPLRFAAIDGLGNAGTEDELIVCVTPLIPDNLNACDATIPPPFAVLSLDWDTNVDLDLVVVTPEGKVVDPKHPSTAPIVDGGVTPTMNDGVLDHDSNADCVIDGTDREDLVWQNKPVAGDYLVYARLASACGLPATRFTATLWLAQSTGPKTQTIAPVLAVSGEVTASLASGDQGLGSYVTNFSIH